MEDKLITKSAQLQKKRKRTNHWKQLISAMACIVVFCTTYALILPAITMEKESYCGYEEHKHEEACYGTNLICTVSEDDASAEQAGTSEEIENTDLMETAVTDVPEIVSHVHGTECYVQEKNLICILEEIEGHTHGDECKGTQETLICELEEAEGHTHDETCVEVTETNVCGLEEIEAHAHDESCYKVVDVLSCQQEEVLTTESVTQEASEIEADLKEETAEEHQHNESCYEQILICELEEHEHVLNCYSNPEADLETETTWEATLPSELSGIWAEDIIAVAKSQLGYEESIKNYQAVENDVTKGYTRYGAWYGDPYGDWSAMFVSFCLNYAEIPVEAMPWDSDCQNWIQTLIDRNQYVSAEDYEPEPGDLIFFSMTKNGTADRVGIVVSYEDNKLQTIEGDSNNQVEYASYQVDDARILGYGELPENPELELPENLDFEADGSEEAGTEGNGTDEDNAEGNGTDGDNAEGNGTDEDNAKGNVVEDEISDDTTESYISSELKKIILLDDGKVEVAAVEDGIAETAFESWITSIVVQKEENGTWVDVPSGGTVSEDDALQFRINYVVPGGTLSEENRIITYQLPADITAVNEESGYVMNGTTVVGTYTISQSGFITIEYTEDYAKQNATGLPITDAYITFGVVVEEIESDTQGNADIEFKDNLHVTFVVEDKINTNGDLHVEKTARDVNQTNGTVTYTITVTSENGTGSTVTLKDVMTNVEFKDGFTIVDKDGKVVSNVTAPGAGSEEFTLTLPKMSAGDKYIITYTAQLEEILNGTVTATNKVTVNSTNTDGAKLEDEAEVPTGFTNELLNKSGKLSEDGRTIQWTIVINQNKQDISGWTLSDTLNGTAFTGPVTISPAVNGQTSISLPYTFPKTSETYTITYETAVDNSLGNNSVSNVAGLTPGTGTGVTDGATVGTGTYNPLKKTADKLVDNGDGTATITWTATIDASQGDIEATWYYHDDAWNNQWFTETQQRELVTVLAQLGYKNEVTWGNKNVNINGTIQSKPAQFTVTFSAPLRQGNKITFTYHTTAPIGDGKSIITFRNNANVNGKVTSYDSATYSPVVFKYDEHSPNGGSETNHDYYDRNLYDQMPGVLKWYFTVSIPEGHYNEDVVITEYLPEGVTLYSDRYPINMTGANGDGWFIFQNSNGQIVGSATITYPYNGVSYRVTATIVDDRTIKITLPKEMLQAIGNTTLKFRVQTKIDRDYNWPTSEDGNLVQVPFENKVTVETASGTTLGQDSQTQLITKNENYNAIKKGLGTVKDNIIPYSIVINPDGNDMVKNADTLTFEDVMRYVVDSSKPFNISILPSTIHVYYRNTDGTKGQELSNTEVPYIYTLGTVTENNTTYNTNTLSITIPDSTPLIIEYSYIASAGEVGWSKELSNTATLKGLSTGDESSSVKMTVIVTESSAGASIDGITIRKVDSKNNGITLEGAVFELWRWDVKVGDYVQVVVDGQSQFTTDKSGQLNITKTGHDLAYNTAYKLVEVKAPDGYIGQSEAYVFSVVSTDTTTNPICKPSDYKGVDHISGDIIFYENTENKTEITINKLWLNVDGTTASKSDGSVKIALWRKSGDKIDEQCVNPDSEDGTYTISAPNWTLTIDDLPKNVIDADGTATADVYEYYIKEVDAKGYNVTYENNNGITSGTIIVTNQDTKEYVLPETGGPGTNVYTAGGILLMCAAALLYINKKNQKRGGKISTGN